jgi:hypothetical protein
MTTAEHTDEALGRSKGGFSTKIHLRAEGGVGSRLPCSVITEQGSGTNRASSRH